MKLVTILLLFCVHSADPAPCSGTEKMVVFCAKEDVLTIPGTATTQWNFQTPNEDHHDNLAFVNTDPAGLKGPLQVKNTGVYFATSGDTVQKYTIIVDAKACTEGINNVCDVAVGGAIKLASQHTSAVTWVFKGKDGSEKPVSDAGANDPPKFTDTDKKQLGLFNMVKAQSGTYEASVTAGDTKKFKVEVRTTVTSATVEKKNSCDLTLECKVDGDFETITWAKNGSPMTDNGAKIKIEKPMLTIGELGTPDNGQYTCKAEGYVADQKTSPKFDYTYAAPTAISTVSISRSGRILTCVAQGDVREYQWLRDEDNVADDDGTTVGNDGSKFTLTARAKGNFVCEVTGCTGSKVKSEAILVNGRSEETEETTEKTPTDNLKPPGAATRGVSCSVALLVISVLVGLYVTML